MAVVIELRSGQDSENHMGIALIRDVPGCLSESSTTDVYE